MVSFLDFDKTASFTEVEGDDGVDLLDSHCQPLSNEELAELDRWTMKGIRDGDDDDDNDEVEIHKEKGLTLNGLQEVFEKVDKIVDYFKGNDPFYDRAAEFEQGIRDLLSPYQSILNESYVEGSKPPLIPSPKKTAKKKSVMGKEHIDPQPGPSGLQAPVIVEENEMAKDSPLHFSASPLFSV
jgi:hypothetical protein